MDNNEKFSKATIVIEAPTLEMKKNAQKSLENLMQQEKAKDLDYLAKTVKVHAADNHHSAVTIINVKNNNELALTVKCFLQAFYEANSELTIALVLQFLDKIESEIPDLNEAHIH